MPSQDARPRECRLGRALAAEGGRLRNPMGRDACRHLTDASTPQVTHWVVPRIRLRHHGAHVPTPRARPADDKTCGNGGVGETAPKSGRGTPSRQTSTLSGAPCGGCGVAQKWLRHKGRGAEGPAATSEKAAAAAPPTRADPRSALLPCRIQGTSVPVSTARVALIRRARLLRAPTTMRRHHRSAAGTASSRGPVPARRVGLLRCHIAHSMDPHQRCREPLPPGRRPPAFLP